jgi:hypothetical protein
MELKRDFPISFLKPAKYNPRIMEETEHEKLDDVIKYFGLVDPVIFNTKTGVIIGGNQRYEHIKDQEKGFVLELGDISWYFTEEDLKLETVADEKALNLALNKITGYFDDSLVTPMIEEISITDTPLTFIDDEEISRLLGGFDDVKLDTGDGETDGRYDKDGEYAKKQEKHKQQTFYLREGDEWNIGTHKFIVGPIDENQKINITIKGSDILIGLSSTENIDEEMYLFMSKNKQVIEDSKPNYDE